MKITRLETELYIAPPPERPITDALRANRHPGRVHLKVHTDKGIIGSSSVGFSSIRGANQTLQTMLDEEVAPLLAARDPLAIRLIHEDLKRALEEQAIHGMTMYALTACECRPLGHLWTGDGTTRAPPCGPGARSSASPIRWWVGCT